MKLQEKDVTDLLVAAIVIFLSLIVISLLPPLGLLIMRFLGIVAVVSFGFWIVSMYSSGTDIRRLIKSLVITAFIWICLSGWRPIDIGLVVCIFGQLATVYKYRARIFT